VKRFGGRKHYLRMNHIKFSLLVILMTATTAFAAGPSISSLLCKSDEVQFGSCRDKQWITDNLSDSKVVAYGECPRLLNPKLTGCAIWFAELNSETSVAFESTVHFMTTTKCKNDEPNCHGGYARTGRLNITFALSNDRIATGAVKVAGAVPLLNAQPIGSIEWTENHNSDTYTVYDPRKSSLGGGGVSDKPFSLSKEDCAITMTSMKTTGGKDDGGKTATYPIVAGGVAILLTGRAPSGLQPVARPGSDTTATDSFKNFSGSIPLIVARTIGEWANTSGVCGNVP